jgi:hypothetical protein
MLAGPCPKPRVVNAAQAWRIWSCAPRNGHISFHFLQSLGHLAETRGLRFRSLNNVFHFIYRDRLPAWIALYVHD